MSLTGKVALVARGTRGAGRGIAVELEAPRAHVQVPLRLHQRLHARPHDLGEQILARPSTHFYRKQLTRPMKLGDAFLRLAEMATPRP